MITIETLIADVLKLPQSSITEGTAMSNTREWDSLKHMELILTIEKNCSIELTGDEIAEMTSVTNIKTILKKHGV
ncbi:MAG: acyl carrier protein [Alphaproteobacteria bacterium]